MGYYQGVISDRPQKLRIHAFGLADDNESKFYHLLTEIKTFGIGIGKSIYRDSATTPDPDPDPEQRWFNPAMLINRSMCKFIVFWIEKDVGCLYVGHIASLKINHKRRKGEDVYSLLIHYPDYDYRNYDTPINTIFFMFYSGNLTKHITVFADESQVRTLLIKSIRDKLEDSNKKNIFDMALEKLFLKKSSIMIVTEGTLSLCIITCRMAQRYLHLLMYRYFKKILIASLKCCTTIITKTTRASCCFLNSMSLVHTAFIPFL